MDQYRFISIERDTTLHTALLSRENTVLIICERITLDFAFANETQYILRIFPYPEFGFKAKHFNFLEANDIKYSSVATWLPNCILNQ
jgi:hypothetical protein